MGNVIGIDLGTTNTAVSVVQDGRPVMLEDSHGYKVVPSIVWIGDDGSVKVGQQCKSLLVTDPSRTAFAVKRLLGRRFGSPEVADADPRVGYSINEASDGTCLVELESGTLTPVEVSAHVLKTAREMAERALDGTVDEAVITVPAYFNHAQRAATLEAAKLAGLNCERLLNEPTAAALAYGFRREIDRTLLVFDLGGGTFDVSVLRLSGGVYEILSTLGDTYLGGEDFDHRVVDWVAKRFEAEHGIDLREDRMTLHRLKEAAERAKCELSFTEQVEINLAHVANGKSINETLTRAALLEMVADYVDRSLEVSLNAVKDAGLTVGDIDEVILVGGQTRMPAIREAITDAFGREPSRSVHPEEVVAMGAAVHAASLEADSDVPPAVLIDVTPFDLGIDVAGNMFQPIISRNSTIPASASRVFATARANQSSVQVTVRQGASRVATENEFLGEFVMGGLTPAPRMETKVEVTFQIDTNGMLRVSAMEPATGKQTEITVRNYSEVAQSKGKVSPKIKRAEGADQAQGAEVNDQPPSAQADSATPTAAPPSAAKADSKKSGGGLLGALFGRKKKKIKRTKAEPEMAAEPVSDSIIDQVIAERQAAQHDGPAVSEADIDPKPIQLPEIDPEALASLEPDMDEPSPIAMPSLGVEALEPLETEEAEPEALDTLDLEALEPIGIDALAPLDGDALAPLDGDALAPLDGDALAPLDGDALAPLDGDALAPLDGDDFDDDEDSDDEAGFGSLDAEDASEEAPTEQSAGENDEEQIEQARSALMDRLSKPLGEEVAAVDPEPEAAPIAPEPEPEPEPAPPPARKPAKLKLSYKNPQSMVREYMENLKKGGCFVKTPKPLAVDREVLIEVRVPAIADDPISIPGVVTWSSRDLTELSEGEIPGMGIEYRLDDIAVATIEARLQAVLGA